MNLNDLSPVWDGTREGYGRVRDWWDTPGRLNLHWAGMGGWELLYSPLPGAPVETLRVGSRLIRVGGMLEAWPL